MNAVRMINQLFEFKNMQQFLNRYPRTNLIQLKKNYINNNDKFIKITNSIKPKCINRNNETARSN